MTSRRKGQANQVREAVQKGATVKPAVQGLARLSQQPVPDVLRRAVADPGRAMPTDIQALQHAYGNRAVTGLIQAKPTTLVRQPPPVSVGAVTDSQVTGQAMEGDLAEERGRGRPLPDDTRAHMEGLFDTNLSRVRIHTDQQAARLSRAVNARAFTLKQDIFFNEGRYTPDSASGKELLAHELTHVLQQTGKPQASLIISQPGDRDEQEANTVASMVSQVEAMDCPVTVPQIQAHVARLPGTVQRAVTAGKVAKGLGKAFLMSFVNAIAGPLSYIWTFRDRRKEWRRIGGAMSYGQGKLATAARVLAKGAIILRELAMFAGWTSLLTGVAALIAAAFAPAGLAASAVLGTISTIAGLVAMSAGGLQAVINLILGIGNLVRLRGVDDKLDRSKIKVMVIRDFVGALSGLVGAVGGAVGFGVGGGSVMQSASEIGSKSMGQLAKEFAIGTGAIGQSFAFAGEAQSEMGGLAQEEVKQKVRPLKRKVRLGIFKRQPGIGKQAAKVRAGLKPTPPRLPPRRQPPSLPPRLKPVPSIQKLSLAPDDKAPEQDVTPQMLAELDKVGAAAGMAKGWSGEERQLVGQEKAEVTQELAMANQADTVLGGDVAQVSAVGGHLQEIDEKSGAGAEATEAVPQKLPNKEVTQERGANLEEAHQQLDQIEAKSGEPAPKRGVLGRMGDWLKKGWRRFKGWVLSSMVNLKARLKGIFAKIKVKAAQLLIKVMGLDEPMGEVGDAAASTIANAPATNESLDAAGEEAGAGVTTAQQVVQVVEQAKTSLGS